MAPTAGGFDWGVTALTVAPMSCGCAWYAATFADGLTLRWGEPCGTNRWMHDTARTEG